MARDQPFLPLKDVAAAAGAVLHINQITNRLKKGGLQTYKPCGRLALTDRHKAARLLFANEGLEHRTPEFWRTVVFSDEKIFRTDTTGRVRVRRPRGARYEDRYTVTQDSSGRDSVHVWGWMDGSGCGELYRLTGRHTAATYVEVLEDVLLPSLEVMRPGGEPFVFQHDNAPQHSARLTQQWLASQAEKVTVLDWPGKSPDLNPIENLWAILSEEVSQKNDQGRLRADDLWRRVQEQWDRLRARPSLFESLAGSMVRRLESVVEAGGGQTKY